MHSLLTQGHQGLSNFKIVWVIKVVTGMLQCVQLQVSIYHQFPLNCPAVQRTVYLNVGTEVRAPTGAALVISVDGQLLTQLT